MSIENLKITQTGDQRFNVQALRMLGQSESYLQKMQGADWETVEESGATIAKWLDER
jgi:hypothetical protein